LAGAIARLVSLRWKSLAAALCVGRWPTRV
jgi:hypothetical protein